MTLSRELEMLAEEFRIYARAECNPKTARWTQWADTCEAAAKELDGRAERCASRPREPEGAPDA